MIAVILRPMRTQNYREKQECSVIIAGGRPRYRIPVVAQDPAASHFPPLIRIGCPGGGSFA